MKILIINVSLNFRISRELVIVILQLNTITDQFQSFQVQSRIINSKNQWTKFELMIIDNVDGKKSQN